MPCILSKKTWLKHYIHYTTVTTLFCIKITIVLHQALDLLLSKTEKTLSKLFKLQQSQARINFVQEPVTFLYINTSNLYLSVCHVVLDAEDVVGPGHLELGRVLVRVLHTTHTPSRQGRQSTSFYISMLS